MTFEEFENASIVEQVAELKRMANAMPEEPPCLICRDGYVCWWHRNGFDQSKVTA